MISITLTDTDAIAWLQHRMAVQPAAEPMPHSVLAIAPPAAAPPAPVAETPKRGRPPKQAAPAPAAEPVEHPPSSTQPSAPAAPVMSKDEYRAFCREASLKIGVDAVKAINGCPLDQLDVLLIPAKVEALNAALGDGGL